MPPNNPMTEGEALAVDAACAAFARLDGIADWSDPSWQESHQIEAGRLRTRMRAAITAHTAASGGEVAGKFGVGVDVSQDGVQVTVICREGLIDTVIHSELHPLPSQPCAKPAAWMTWHPQVNDGRRSPTECSLSSEAELVGWKARPLIYGDTPPPAAVPADALTNLVERWLLHSDPYHGKCASELAALIPKGADHG